MAFGDTNKAEPHLVGLDKKGRELLKAYALARVYTNDNKEVTAKMVRETFEAIIDAVPNLLDDNLDLRAYTEAFFTLADCTYDGVSQIYTFVLDNTAVNPDDDSTLVCDGMDWVFGVDYFIDGTILVFTIDNDIEDTELLEFLVKYRYFL